MADLNKYILNAEREKNFIKEVANNIEEQTKILTDDLAEVLHTDSNASYQFPVLDESKDIAVSTVSEMGVIPVSSLGLKNITVPMKRYSTIVVISKESLKWENIALENEIKKGMARGLAKALNKDYIALVTGEGVKDVTGTSNLINDISDAMTQLETIGRETTRVILPTTRKGEIRKLIQSQTDSLINLESAFSTPITFMSELGANKGLCVDNSQIKLILGGVEIDVLEEGTVVDGETTINLGQQYAVAFRCNLYACLTQFNPQARIK